MEKAFIARIGDETDQIKIRDKAWDIARPVNISTYWSGEAAESGRHFEARLMWNASALFVRFDARQDEPPIVGHDPFFDKKTMHLWDRDVCEIFIAPDSDLPAHYFEFEAAPTGEWLDVELFAEADGRRSNWEYASGMRTEAEIGEGRVLISMQIPFTAFGKEPQPGDIWLGNILRCVGTSPGRGYLAWRPTFTPEPAFHVPAAFGQFVFEDQALP